MPSNDNDHGWSHDDPKAPTHVGPGPAPSDPDKLLKEAFDAMWEGEYYNVHRGEGAPEWYEDVFPIPKKDPDNGNNEVHYLELMRMMEDSKSDKRIGYALGALSKMSEKTIESWFKSSRDASGHARVHFFKTYFWKWIHTMAPLLQISGVVLEWQSLRFFAQKAQLMKGPQGDVIGNDEKVATVRKILTDEKWTASGFSALMEGFREARAHYGTPPERD